MAELDVEYHDGITAKLDPLDLVAAGLQELDPLTKSLHYLDGAGPLEMVRRLFTQSGEFTILVTDWQNADIFWQVSRQELLEASSPSGILDLIVDRRKGAFIAICKSLELELAKLGAKDFMLLECTESPTRHPCQPNVIAVWTDLTWAPAERKSDG